MEKIDTAGFVMCNMCVMMTETQTIEGGQKRCVLTRREKKKQAQNLIKLIPDSKKRNSLKIWQKYSPDLTSSKKYVSLGN